MEKCGLTLGECGLYEKDEIATNIFIWYEKNYTHEDRLHIHKRSQLAYVEEGYQYFHIENSIYLVPQHHVIWIPTMMGHRTTSNSKATNLMLLLIRNVPTVDFFNNVHVFYAPKVLREMLNYAQKWNGDKNIYDDKDSFMTAIIDNLPNFCMENASLAIPVPNDIRLLPLCDYINKNYNNNIRINDFESLTAMSARNLQRIFKQQTGITIQKYVQLIRILKSIELIDTGEFTLSEIAYKVGYKSLSAFRSSYNSIMKV